MIRIVQLIARNFHLTFPKKMRDLTMQIFGHEGLLDRRDTADLAHCVVFNEDFHRLNSIRVGTHLALRKLLNPAKWLEFVIVTPLELLGWALQRGSASLAVFSRKKQTNVLMQELFALFQMTAFCCSGVSILINLAISPLIWAIQLVLAPARTIIRPFLQTMKKNPKLGKVILLLTAITTAILVLSGSVVGGLALLSASLATPLLAAGLSAFLVLGFITKAFNTLSDLYHGFRNVIHKPNVYKQNNDVYRRNEKTGYPVEKKCITDTPNKKALDSQPTINLPTVFLNTDQNKVWIYGLAPNGKKALTLVASTKDSYDEIISLTGNLEENKPSVVKSIAVCQAIGKGHFPQKTGVDSGVAEYLHNMDADETDITFPDDQTTAKTISLFFGADSLFFSPKKKAPSNGDSLKQPVPPGHVPPNATSPSLH